MKLRFTCIAFLSVMHISVAYADKTAHVRIIHTNDIHSALDILPKLSAFVEEQKRTALEEGIIPILDDAGDFYSGSVMHTLAPRSDLPWNPELEFLKQHGFTSILGNHEWDATQEGLATMFQKLGMTYPGGVLASNIVLNSPDEGGDNMLSPYFYQGIMVLNNEGEVIDAYHLSKLNRVMTHAHHKPHLPIARAVLRVYKIGDEEFKVGFIGLMGPNAVGGSVITRKGTGVEFKKYDGPVVERIVKHLRKLGAELIIADVHAGREPTGVKEAEEDKDLTHAIPDIDLISAGHTHVAYAANPKEAPLIRYQSGAHGQAVVTDLTYSVKDGHRRTLTIDRSTIIDKNYLNQRWNESGDDYKSQALFSEEDVFHYKREFDKLIVNDPRYTIDLNSGVNIALRHDIKLLNLIPGTIAAKEMGDASSYQAEIPLGRIVTTAVREELNEVLLSENQEPVDMILTGIELVRTEFPVGRPTLFADIFAMNSRGVTKSESGDLIPDGGKIAVMHMTKGDLYRLVAIMEFYSRRVEVEATMAYSEGLEFTYDPNDIPILNNLKNFKLNGIPYEDMPEVIKVGISSFIAQNIREKAYGLIDIVLVHQIDPVDHPMTMDILLSRYLHKNRRVLEAKGVTGTADLRRNIYEEQKQRWNNLP